MKMKINKILFGFCFFSLMVSVFICQAGGLIKGQEETDKEYLQEFIGLYNRKQFGFHASTNAASLFEYINLGKLLYTTSKTDYIFFRLLTNRLKFSDAEVIMAPVLEMFVAQIPLAIGRHTMSMLSWNERLETMKLDIEQKMVTCFDDMVSHMYSHGRVAASKMMTNETMSIVKSYFPDPFTEQFDGYWTNRLRGQVKSLLELSIQRLMWEGSAFQGIWESVNKIAFGMYQLCNEQIICHSDDLDDLYCSLVHRFIYFLKLTGNQYPSSFYQNIEFYIANGYSSWLDFEVDAGIRTKKSLLLEEVFSCKMKALAYERTGILSQ